MNKTVDAPMTDEELNRQYADSTQKMTVGRFWMGIGIGIAVLSMLLIFSSFQTFHVGTWLFWFFIACIPLLYGVIQYEKGKKVIVNISQSLVPSALNAILDDLYYDPNARLSNAIVETDMGFPSSFIEIRGNDYISGVYRGMRVEMSDIQLIEEKQIRTNNGTKTVRVTIFQGPWIVCDFGKELACDLLLSERVVLGWLAAIGGIKTENEAFNKRFYIRCASEHDAFYLLTPQMMERILEMDDRTKGDSYLRFQTNGKVMLALNCRKNFFEADFSVGNVAELRRKYEGEIRHLMNLLDTLRLAESIE